MLRTSASDMSARLSHGIFDPLNTGPALNRATSVSSSHRVMCPVVASGVRFGVTNSYAGSVRFGSA